MAEPEKCGRTVGVEEEFLLVSPDGSQVLAAADRVLARAADADAEAEAELTLEQAETASGVRTDIPSLRADLVARRRALAAAAEEVGVRIAATGSSPVPVSPHTTPTARYEEMTERFGLVGRRQLTCGMHVHVGVESREEGVHVLDRIRPWLHVLTAMSANSPFWDDADTDYASYRSVAWGQWPGAGPSDVFGSLEAYDRTVEQLVATDVLLDDGMVYFDARLSAKYPTVEIRVTDVCTAVDDAVLLAALARALVETAAADDRESPALPTVLLKAAAWRSCRSGLSGDLVDTRVARPVPAWDAVSAFVEHCSVALERCGDLDLVTSSLARLRSVGTGADGQRRTASEHGLGAVLGDVADRTLSL